MKKSFCVVFAVLSLLLCTCFTFVSADDGSSNFNVSFVIFFTIYSVLLLVVLGIMIWLIIRERKSHNIKDTVEAEDEDYTDITLEVKNYNHSRMDVYNKSVVLASNSPRRLQLLKPYFNDITVCPQSIDERSEKIDPADIAEDIAKAKIGSLADDYYNSFVISADTIVAMDGKIYGKPVDEADAASILKELSDKWHTVITGYCVCYKGCCKSGSETCQVKFKNLTDSDIADYITTRSPMDKAGAYGIQDNVTVDTFVGDIDNIIGLPLDKILQVCTELVNEENKNGKN